MILLICSLTSAAQAQYAVFQANGQPRFPDEMRGKTADEVLEWARLNGHFGLKTPSGVAAIELGGTWGNTRYSLQNQFTNTLLSKSSPVGVIEIENLTLAERRVLAAPFWGSPTHSAALIHSHGGEIELYATQKITIRLRDRDILLLVADSDRAEYPSPVFGIRPEWVGIAGHNPWFLSRLEDPKHSYHTHDLPFVRSQFDSIEEALSMLVTRISTLREQIQGEEQALIRQVSAAQKLTILRIPTGASFRALPLKDQLDVECLVTEEYREFGFQTVDKALRALQTAQVSENELALMMSIRSASGVELRVEAFRRSASTLP